MTSLTQSIVHLFETERFYAELLLQMDRIVSKQIPTAGVCVKDRIQLHVNPDFFDSLSPKERVSILKHECQHVFNDHISRSKELAPDVYTKKNEDIASDIIAQMKHRSINIACDLAINPGIQNVPENACLPAKFKLPDGQTMEWYHQQLKDNEQAKQLMEYDGHPLWGESEGEKEELKQKIKQAVNEAAQRTRFAGRMTSEDELLVSRLNYKPRNWKSDLRRFAARVLDIKLDTSKKKRNRRYGVMYPGNIKIEELHIGVAIDTSGSVSDQALCQFMAEIGNIAKYAKVTVVEADTEVKNSYIFDPKKTYKVKGRGGTAYQPAFDFFTTESEVDGVIYFGDMDCFDTEALKKPKYPVLWAIVGSQNPPVTWGSQLRIEINSP